MEFEEQELIRMVAIGTVFAFLIRISEFRMNSEYHGRRRGEI